MNWVDPTWPGGDTWYVWPEWEPETGDWVDEPWEGDWIAEGAEGAAGGLWEWLLVPVGEAGAGAIGAAVAGGIAIGGAIAAPIPVFTDPDYSGFGGTARWWWDHTFGEKKWKDLKWIWSDD